LQTEEERDSDVPGTVVGDITDTLVKGHVELKQLEHPLAGLNTSNDGSENVTDVGLSKGLQPLSLSKVSLARSCTPRDCLPIASWNQDDSLSEILGSNNVGLPEKSEKNSLKFTETVMLSLTPAVLLGKPEASTSETIVDSLPTPGNVSHLLSALRKSPQTAHMTVSFNETMEVRYFYRSDDEIAIMKQCALERRRQQESRRRLRRVRQGIRVSSSLLRSNKLASLFYHGCSDDGILNGMSRPDALDDDEDTRFDDGDFDGSVFHCGMHFQRHGEPSDTESDDDVPLNVQDENVKTFAFHGVVDGLASLISDVMIDMKPISPQNKTDDEVVPVDEVHLTNVDDDDSSDPWFITSLCGSHSKIIALKE
jgi:hypothetical protein